MQGLISRTRALFAEGAPLAKIVDSRLSVDLEMFSRGGLAVLQAIEAGGCDTLHHRPAIGKGKQARLLGRALVTHLVSRAPKTDATASPADESAIVKSYEQCHRIARNAHSNFYYAFFLLPRAKRDGLAALYAFMRMVDDVADEGHDLAAKQRGLAKWRAALDEAVTGDGHPKA